MSQTSPFAVKDTGGIAYKVDVVSSAYSMLRISGLTVQPSPEDLELALNRLEDMAAEWESRNICAGFNFEDEPDPNSDIGVIRAYWNAFKTNLAIRLIADFNKQVPQTLHMQASQSLSSMAGRIGLQRLQQVQYPHRMPRGSGNTQRYNRWARFYRNTFNTINSCATESMFIGDVADFVEHFDAYLDGETIASYSITTDSGLDLISDSNTDDDVIYRIEAGTPSTAATDGGALVTIIVTTSTGRVETRQTLFDISATA